MINTELFSAEWQKIETKLDQIGALGFQQGGIDGYTIDSEGVTIKSSQYFSGCGTDYYDYYVAFEDINKPIEFFQDLLVKQHKAEEERKNKAREADEERIKKQELQRLKELQKKYGIIP